MATVTKRNKAEMLRMWVEYKKAPDPQVKNTLIEEYLPIVRYVAERLIERLPHNVQVEDIASAGIFGLIDAIDKFDLDRGVKFETYCVGRIRGAMLDELRAMDWVPRLTRARANKLEGAYTMLEKKLGRAPADTEVAEELKVSLNELDELYRDVSGASVLSLQKRPHGKDESALGVDIMEDTRVEGPVEESARRDFIEYVQKNLTTKERYILMLYYFDELTLKEIGSILGLSESRVCQLHARLMTRLRTYLRKVQDEAL
jgi:RNA polymerase sigma factor for flagellar operon FliA